MAKLYEGLSAEAFDFWCAPVFKASDGTLYCPGFTGDVYAKNPWDVVTIQGTTKTPGLCEVKVNKGRDLDKKKASGSDGARVTFHGIDPAQVELEITIWTPEQLKKLEELWKQIFPQSNKRPKGTSPNEPWPPAFDVEHPALKRHAVKSLVFIKGEGPDPGRFPKSRSFRISAIEFLPPKKSKASTPVKSKGSTLDPKTSDYPTPGANKKNTGP